MNNKNIFIKNNSSLESTDKNLSEENLSDELNRIINNNSNKTNNSNNVNNLNKINNQNVHNTSSENTINLSNLYNKINSVINEYNNCKIIGEIISFKISDTNAWINVKTDEFQMLCIFWQITSNKNFANITPKPGDKFMFKGKLGIMKKNLSMYFNVKSMEKYGKGEYLDIYEQYRIKIRELGLNKFKKQLNLFPSTVGIITAIGGAAIQDILQTFRLDKFTGKIIIKNAFVQGYQCPTSIINSIQWFETNYSIEQIDILIITRGGGSWDDLCGFSDWDLLIKLSDTKFITLSAVGHQIDNQLTDEICDYKFATPSIGAKFIVETQNKYKLYLSKYKSSLEQLIDKYLNLKTKFNNCIVANYDNIIKKYEFKQVFDKTKKYSYKINSIISKYNYLKNIFYSKLSNIKPTIMRKNELISINDFITPFSLKIGTLNYLVFSSYLFIKSLACINK